jgi:hypothetical protein
VLRVSTSIETQIDSYNLKVRASLSYFILQLTANVAYVGGPTRCHTVLLMVERGLSDSIQNNSI